MSSLTAERIINAPLKKVWLAAGDFKRSPLQSLPIEIVKEGDASRHGIGCERKITSGKRVIHERLISIDPPYSYEYEMLSGIPAKRYYGKVELRTAGSSTSVKWSAEITPKYPGTGWIIRMITGRNFVKFLNELENIRYPS
jgi:hypothetical protein